MPRISRRAALGAASALVAAAGAQAADAVPYPDADLIAACAQYPMVEAALGTEADENGPCHAAYDRVFTIIESTSARTMEGILAKARTAAFATKARDGEFHWEGSVGEYWAFGVVEDLLRLHGEVA